jgi:hypothetical protein
MPYARWPMPGSTLASPNRPWPVGAPAHPPARHAGAGPGLRPGTGPRPCRHPPDRHPARSAGPQRLGPRRQCQPAGTAVRLEERRIADLHGQGRITAARALARDVAARRPGHHPGAHRCRPCTPAHGPQDSAAALPLLQQAVAADPHNFDLQVDTGNAWVPGRRPSPGLAPMPKPRRWPCPASRLAARLAGTVWTHGPQDKAQVVLDTVARDPQADRTELLRAVPACSGHSAITPKPPSCSARHWTAWHPPRPQNA